MKSSKRLALTGLCLFCAFTAASALASTAHAAEADQVPAIENSVVKVFATIRYPDPFKPWSKQAPSEVSGLPEAPAPEPAPGLRDRGRRALPLTRFTDSGIGRAERARVRRRREGPRMRRGRARLRVRRRQKDGRRQRRSGRFVRVVMFVRPRPHTRVLGRQR